MTKTPQQLRDELGIVPEAEVEPDPIPEDERPPLVTTMCVTCGQVMDISEAPDDWQLQCDGCKKMGRPLPAGYEHLKGGPHDGA